MEKRYTKMLMSYWDKNVSQEILQVLTLLLAFMWCVSN